MTTQKPLWEKVYHGRWSTVYINAGKIIGHLGCRAMAFYDAAKLLPGYDKYSYECAVRDLTVYARREQGEYELHAAARKVLRIIIGPSPADPEYRRWWESRLVSVRQMKESGQPVEWAEAPPVPLEPKGPGEPPRGPGKSSAKKPPAAKRVGKE